MSLRVTILGAGESGLGAALLAKRNGFEVWVSNDRSISPETRKTLEVHQIPFETCHTDRIFLSDRVVKSPGIPMASKVVSALKSRGIPLESEVSFAASFVRSARIIGVTGSNGKTTTTRLITHVLRRAGFTALAVGNIGYGFCHAVFKEPEPQFYVVELSSFQLEEIGRLRCEISVILNISPDHLDRYQNDFRRYALAKFNITKNQKSTDTLIYNAALLHSFPEALDVPAQKHAFYSRDSLPTFRHIHAENVAAVWAVAQRLKISREIFYAACQDFPGLAHRLQTVRTLDGITFVNDSKATNVEAVLHALKVTPSPLIWIVGGADKGGASYEMLRPWIKEKVRAIVYHGKEIHRIQEVFPREIPCEHILDMKGVVHRAFRLANSGDTVLLSPVFASFDLYKNFEERGQAFYREVQTLHNKS